MVENDKSKYTKYMNDKNICTNYRKKNKDNRYVVCLRYFSLDQLTTKNVWNNGRFQTTSLHLRKDVHQG